MATVSGGLNEARLLPRLLTPGQHLANPHKPHSPPLASGETAVDRPPVRPGSVRVCSGLGLGHMGSGEAWAWGWGPACGTWSSEDFSLQDAVLHIQLGLPSRDVSGISHNAGNVLYLHYPIPSPLTRCDTNPPKAGAQVRAQVRAQVGSHRSDLLLGLLGQLGPRPV